jgi:hypothetical protein
MRGNYETYGLNHVVFENSWSDGSPANNELYRDNFVIGTERIGCAISDPDEPTGVIAYQEPN